MNSTYKRLVREKKWTVLLLSLPEDEPTEIEFSAYEHLKSCRMVAYQPYGDLRKFRFSTRMVGENRIEITKTKRNVRQK